MRSVIIGFGRIANSIRYDKKMSWYFPYASHAQVLSDHPDFQWLGVVDPDPEAQSDARKWGVPYVGTLEMVAEKVRPEFAVITTPPHTRMEIVKSLPDLQAIMIEKPVGSEGMVLMAYCEQRDIEVTVNFWRRGVGAYMQLPSRFGELIGRPQAVFCTYGNGLYNNGSHLVDFLRMLFGEVTDVKSLGVPERLGVLGCSGPVDDYHASFFLDFGGIPAFVAPLDFSKYREVGVDIWGTEGRLFICQESLKLLHYHMDFHRSMENQKEIANDIFDVEAVDVRYGLHNLYDAISERKTRSPGENGLIVEHILDTVANGPS